MRNVKRRLEALEQQHKETQKPGMLGIRIFEQSPNDPALFYPVAGPHNPDWQVYTDSEIAALQAAGWQTVTVLRPAGTHKEEVGA